MSCAFSSAVALCGAVRRSDGDRRDCRMAQTPRTCAGFGSCPSLAAPLRGRTTQSAPQRSTSTAIGSPLLVTCMANPRRVAKVQQQMRREISSMLQTDKVSHVSPAVAQSSPRVETLTLLPQNALRRRTKFSTLTRRVPPQRVLSSAELAQHDITGRAHGCG